MNMLKKAIYTEGSLIRDNLRNLWLKNYVLLCGYVFEKNNRATNALLPRFPHCPKQHKSPKTRRPKRDGS